MQVSYDMQKAWDARSRKFYGSRYDYRRNAVGQQRLYRCTHQPNVKSHVKHGSTHIFAQVLLADALVIQQEAVNGTDACCIGTQL